MTSLAKYAIFVLFAALAVIVLDHSAAGAPVDAVDRGNLNIGKVQIIYDILNSTYTISTSEDVSASVLRSIVERTQHLVDLALKNEVGKT